MTVTQTSPEDIYRRAKNLYEQHIRAQVENIYDGKIIMIDVDSGDYEIDDVGVAASERLRQRHPNAVLCALRIGYEAVDGFGGTPWRVKHDADSDYSPTLTLKGSKRWQYPCAN